MTTQEVATDVAKTISETLVFNTPMLVSAIILTITFAAIFTEELHKIHRTKIVMLGAGAMLIFGQIFGFYNPELAIEAIDWNVVLMLGTMMAFVTIMIPTGGFQSIAYTMARFSKGQLFLLMTLLATSIAVLSLFLNNLTTIVIFGPLIILICQALRVSPVPYLLAAAMMSNIGGVATLVGDPPNLMIGSAANIGFNPFFIHMGPSILAVFLVTLISLKLIFRKKLRVTPEKISFDTEDVITDKKTWYASLAILGLMIALFILQESLGWEAWVVSALGLTLLLFVNHKSDIDKYLADIELSLLLFFVSLFVIIGGVEHSHFLEYVGQFILPFVQQDMLMACLILLWVSAILSAAIDNIPFTAAMIPIILGLETQGINVTPMWWALALGVGLGGNGTHLGSSVNMFVVALSERLAKKEGKHSLAITPWVWFKKGTPITIIGLITSSIIMWSFFDFYSTLN